MMKQMPTITEKENAVDFNYRGGKLEFKDVTFKHMGSQD